MLCIAALGLLYNTTAFLIQATLCNVQTSTAPILVFMLHQAASLLHECYHLQSSKPYGQMMKSRQVIAHLYFGHALTVSLTMFVQDRS